MTASEQPFRNPYRRYARISFALLVGGVALFAAGFSLPRDWQVGALLVGVLGGSMGLIFWIAMAITARSVEAQLVAFRDGEHLARWTLPPDPWNVFAREMRAKGLMIGNIIGGMIAGVVLLVGALIWSDGDAFGTSVMLAGPPLGLLGALIFRTVMGGQWRVRRAPVQLVYGEQGAMLDGVLITWQSFGLALLGASVDAEGARIVIHGKTTGGEVDSEFTHRLPFPSTETALAERVARQIEAACHGRPLEEESS